MIDKMIKNTIREIIITILFVIIATLGWNVSAMDLTVSKTFITNQQASLKLEYQKKDGYDYLIISNIFQSEKKYQLSLFVNEESDDKTIVINGFTHYLKEFTKNENNNYFEYVIIIDNLIASSVSYELSINVNNNVNYYYRLAELTEI